MGHAVYDGSCRGLAKRAGCMVVSVECRHAPEHLFPAAHDDVLAATRWVLASAASIGGDPTRVAIAGKSAGGEHGGRHLHRLSQLGGPQLVFQLLVYPVTSTAMDTASYAEAADAKPLCSGFMNWFFGQTITDLSDLADPRLNLLSAPHDRLAGLPPALVITAERDPLRDEGEAFAEGLRSAGVAVEATRYDGVPHELFGAAAVLDKAAQAQDEAARALRFAFAGAFEKGIAIGAGQCPVRRYNRELRDLIIAGRARPSFLVSHELPLDQAADAYEKFDARQEGWTKVILHPAA